MTEHEPTFERWIELWEAGRDDEADVVAGDAYLTNWEEWCRIVQHYCDGGSPPGEGEL